MHKRAVKNPARQTETRKKQSREALRKLRSNSENQERVQQIPVFTSVRRHLSTVA